MNKARSYLLQLIGTTCVDCACINCNKTVTTDFWDLYREAPVCEACAVLQVLEEGELDDYE